MTSYFSKTIVFIVFYSSIFAQSEMRKNYIQLTGSCYDFGTGRDLIVDVFFTDQNGDHFLGKSNDEGIFTLNLPLAASMLRFDSKGFRSVHLPISFIGIPEAAIKFSFSVPTTSIDSASISLENRLLWSVNDGGQDYNVVFTNPNTKADFKSRAANNLFNSFTYPNIPPGEYNVFAMDRLGSKFCETTLALKRGFTFFYFDIEKCSEKLRSTSRTLESQKHVLYFEQSSFELTGRSKTQLDSIANLLKTYTKAAVNVFGYTDNVGEKDKNVTLSEYRARIVSNYLIARGVSDKRITKKWFGSNFLASSSDKKLNRRVVVEIINTGQ